ncbi:MAG: hypothetical protein ALAOOOJD_01189 [bacterium]|nr:hypothetical protein [bacterium]
MNRHLQPLLRRGFDRRINFVIGVKKQTAGIFISIIFQQGRTARAERAVNGNFNAPHREMIIKQADLRAVLQKRIGVSAGAANEFVNAHLHFPLAVETLP